jgi:selenide,water dikinase
MALAVHRALGNARVMILESGEWILSGYSGRFRERALRILRDRGIAVRLGSRVATVRPGEVEIEGGAILPSRLTVWLTGAVAWPVFRDSGLPVDERGFLWLDDSLRSVADPRVFAAGDCGTLASHPETPKAGVIAVREAPILWKSLKAAVLGEQPPRYTPRERFLSILNTADGRALLDYKGIVSHSRWAWRLKDAIDRRFMARYQGLLK